VLSTQQRTEPALAHRYQARVCTSYYTCSTTTTGTSEKIMGAAGRSLQGLLGGYTKKGVCLNESLTAHRGGTGQRLCTAIKHAYVQMQHRHNRRQPAEYARSGA
jgi:hypothetical protein